MLLGMLLGWTACGSGEGTGEQGMAPPGAASASTEARVDGREVIALWLDSSNPRIAQQTEHVFSATAQLADGFTADVTEKVRWTVQDIAPSQGVASIDDRGHLRAQAAGEVLVSAALGSQRASTRDSHRCHSDHPDHDPSQGDHRQGDDAAVHADRHVFRRHHAGPHCTCDLEHQRCRARRWRGG